MRNLRLALVAAVSLVAVSAFAEELDVVTEVAEDQQEIVVLSLEDEESSEEADALLAQTEVLEDCGCGKGKPKKPGN